MISCKHVRVCVREVVICLQQCVVWMLGVVLGDGLLEPLFTVS